jgi:hypothetical protein
VLLKEKPGGVKQAFKPRCPDVLPYGYERPQGQCTGFACVTAYLFDL